MDALFHFANPDTRPYKKKNLSLVPSAFHSKNPLNYDKNDEEEEEVEEEEENKDLIKTKKDNENLIVSGADTQILKKSSTIKTN